MVDIIQLGDFTPQQFSDITEQYAAHILSIRKGFSDDIAALADSYFHDCTIVSMGKSAGEVRVVLEGSRVLRSTGLRLHGTHQLIFRDADLTIIEPLHDPDYCLYEEVSQKGTSWVYSAILDIGELEIRFETCSITSSQPER